MSAKAKEGVEFSIAIVGPMDDRRSQGKIAVSQHITNIADAVQRCIPELARRHPNLSVTCQSARDIRMGAIPKTVFGFLDQADLVIADISYDSPNTFYEIAYLHALGTPVIYLAKKTSKIPFYFQSLLVMKVDQYTPENIQNVIFDPIDFTVTTSEAPAEADNLITQYFGSTPMLHASAERGVATGYFYNFLFPVLHENVGVVVSNREYDQLVCIKPDSFSDDGVLLRELEEHPKYKKTVTLPATLSRRETMDFKAFDRVLLDFPTPVDSLKISPRYQSFKNNNIGPDTDKNTRRFERKLINGFVSSAMGHVNNYPGVNPNLIKFMSAAEFRETFLAKEAVVDAEGTASGD